MALALGTRLGPYKITAQIGVGGMGEVYRATDTNLARQVAIKVLPEAVASDTERLARFDREAKTLASLNHPNIAQIYGLQKTDCIRALVMELVEGPTLADRITQGAIPMDEALPIAKQIAEALEAAHEQGIIHRDLKPANIKVRPDGTVKVLDFGLAKALEPCGASSEGGMVSSHSPTITSPVMTLAGVILGTAAYMSPEQARGQTVDKRTDIWAFGCVLYEMLTGVRAFAGETVTEALAAVMRAEPDWSPLPRELPPTLLAFLRCCLQKDVRARVADIRDMRLAIDGAFDSPVPTLISGVAPKRLRTSGLVAAAASIVAAVLVIPAVRHLREPPAAAAPEARLDIVTPATADATGFALSPDGSRLAFVASDEAGGTRLWLRPLDSTNVQPIEGTRGAATPFWSPDGRSIAFVADGKLKRVDLGGGAPQTLAMVAAARGGAWNSDGTILFTTATTDAPLFRINASLPGPAQPVTKLNRHISHRFPIFLPDGHRFLFYAQATGDAQGIYLGALDSSDVYQLTTSDAAGAYLANGWLLWPRDGTLLAQRLDLERHALTGEPVTVANPVVFDGPTNAMAVTTSATGLMAYRSGLLGRRQLAWFDRLGREFGTLGSPDDKSLSSPSVSPDGRAAAVHRAIERNADIWIVDEARSTRFTYDQAADRYPVWTRDGSAIVFDSNRTGTRDLYRKDVNGSKAEERLVESSQDKLANDISRDGRFLLYQSIDSHGGRDLWVLPLGGGAPWVFLKTAAAERFGQFSPDGRWVAYMSNESGHDEIFLRRFVPPSASHATSQSERQWQITTTGGAYPRWRSDGKELFYTGPAAQMMAVSVSLSETSVEYGAPVTLFRTRIFGGGIDTGLGIQYDVSRDGRFLINTVLEDAVKPITLVQNWRPEVR